MSCACGVTVQSGLIGDALASLDAEGVAEAVVAGGEVVVELSRREVAVVPHQLRLPVDVEVVVAEPGEAAAEAVAVGVDAAVAARRRRRCRPCRS